MPPACASRPRGSPIAPTNPTPRLPRGIKPGSLIDDPEVVVARAVRMANDGTVLALDGSVLRLAVDTMCVHGDTPGSDQLAATLRAGLEAAGITVRAIGQG